MKLGVGVLSLGAAMIILGRRAVAALKAKPPITLRQARKHERECNSVLTPSPSFIIIYSGTIAVPINGTWTNPAKRRCDSKVPYRYIASAEKVARKASMRVGELIIAYECPDCGAFHIGHADQSQIIVRREPDVRRFVLPTTCPHCGGPIPEERRRAAENSGTYTVYCCKKCRDKGGKKARHARRAAQVAYREGTKDRL